MPTATATESIPPLPPDKTPPAVNLEAAEQLIRTRIAVTDGEKLSIRKVAPRSYRVNVWTVIDLTAAVTESRIVRSFYVTICSPDNVDIITD